MSKTHSNTACRARALYKRAQLLPGALLVVIFLLAGQPVAAQDTGGVVATVNGEAIDQSTVDAVTAQLQAGQQAIGEDAVIDELINLKLLSQQAVEAGLHEREDVRSVLELQRLQILSNMYLREISSSIEPTDDELQAEYEKQVESLAKSEYLVSQIMLENEADAKAIIDDLSAGGDFAKLAEEHSTDAGGASGGDLGWVHVDVLPAPMSDALTAMDADTFSDAPVQTDFGWHVLHLREKRGSVPPAFDSVKPQLQQAVLTQRIQVRLDELRADAEIER